MTTTPEQMREAAAKCCDQFDGPVSKSVFLNGQATAAQQIRAAIRAIPIAPQPVAVTVKPLVFNWRKDDAQNPTCWRADGDGFFAYVLIPFDAGYDPAHGVGLWNANPNHRGRIGFASRADAMAYCEASIREQAEGDLRRAKWAMDATIQPADPLSDPRVKALVDALKATRDKLASMAHDQFDGVWTASDFTDETREADAALSAIGGEA